MPACWSYPCNSVAMLLDLLFVSEHTTYLPQLTVYSLPIHQHLFDFANFFVYSCCVPSAPEGVGWPGVVGCGLGSEGGSVLGEHGVVLATANNQQSIAIDC